MMDRLQGENRIDSFVRIADEIVKSLSHFSSVEGVLYIGGLARGFVDRHSDLDMVVLFNNDDPYAKDFLSSLAAQHEDRSGLEIDIEVYFLDEYISREWNEYTRWDLSHAIYAFDRQGEVKKQFERKLALNDDEWRRRLAHPLVYLSWYCCPTDDYVPSMIDLWRDRGHLVSAQYSVNYGIDLILEVIYAMNRSYLPAPKWRLFYTRELNWLPTDFENALMDAMLVKGIDEADSKRRADQVCRLTQEISGQVEREFGLNRDAIRKIYIADVYGIR
ncbi:MAG: nucleotidyltransferase domain-containing protein [Candidatus Thorarchaeota archaeon]|nr:nucleotidyltransferase domain-containing protein [Candidatus Thorarchaeota archaeon]